MSPSAETRVAPTINSLVVYIPARDFQRSCRFYEALGFRPSPGFGGTVDFTLGGHCFRLQDRYVEQWASNCMLLIGVDDADAWHEHARRVIQEHRFTDARIQAPETVEGSRVFHVWDPSGVLLVFIQ
jgi:predicted enzyme related to lactoylglutathione lyase